MTTARQGRLTVAAIATALLFSTHLSAQTSQASQTEGAVGLTDEFVDVLVGAMSLADPLSPPPHQDTEQLFAVLVNDLLVAAVLMDAGAVGIDLPSDVGASPWQSTAERAQALLAQGAPARPKRRLRASAKCTPAPAWKPARRGRIPCRPPSRPPVPPIWRLSAARGTRC